MKNYRSYIFISRRTSLNSSRVQLLKPKTPRQIYEAFVVTGEIPRIRQGGFDVSLDVPVQSFGDIDDAQRFVASLSAQLDAKEAARKEEEIKLKEARRAEIEAAYRELHTEVEASASPDVSTAS